MCRVESVGNLDVEIEHRFDLQRLTIYHVSERLPSSSIAMKARRSFACDPMIETRQSTPITKHMLDQCTHIPLHAGGGIEPDYCFSAVTSFSRTNI